MEAIICAAIAAAGTVAVAFIEGRASRDRKRVESRAELRERESRLSMEMMSANCALSLVTAKKLAGHQTNGDVEEAMKKAADAQAKYSAFLRETAAREVSKL